MSDTEPLSTIGTAIRRIVAGAAFLLRETAIVGLVAAWIGFWGLIVRWHYSQGDLLAVAVTAAVLVAPVAVLGGWHVSALLDAGAIDLLPAAGSPDSS